MKSIKPILRFGILAVLLIAILVLARGRITGPIPNTNNQPTPMSPTQQPISPSEGKPGTIKPPPQSVVITTSGVYSVGGFCTVNIEILSNTLTAQASVIHPLPRPLPKEVYAVKQGCSLIYYDNQVPVEVLSEGMAKTTICFAALPNKKMVVYFYNSLAATPVWAMLETTVENGIACANANSSGIYVATFQNP